jgi:hypothetical protein
VPDAIDGKSKRAGEQNEVMLMAGEGWTIVGNALAGRDLALDHLELELAAGRREAAAREPVFPIGPDALVGAPDERR